MAKRLLEDMIRRHKPEPRPSTFPISRSQPVKAPVAPVVAVPDLVEIPEHTITHDEPVVPTPPPVKIPEPVKYEQPKYSDVETKFASINDVGADGQSGGHSRYALWMVAVASALFLVFALSFLFSSAKITVTPKTKDVNANVNLSAVKDAPEGSLPLDVIVISGQESQTITAGAQKDVSISAKGKVVIYNAYSTSPQALAIDTRLEGSNGKLYKTTTKVTVPAMKGTTPGKVSVGIYAASPGAEYNSGPLDFKIFGFKGTPKYTKFYARSDVNDKATAGNISGGFVGKSNDISDADRAKLLATLKASLKDKLLKQAVGQIPSGFVLFKDGIVLDTHNDSITTTPAANNTVSATLDGTLSGFIFEEKKLAQKIAASVLPPAEDVTGIYIPNIKNLTFALQNRDSLPADLSSINFSLSGNAKIVWKVDEAKLVADMVGQPKKNFNTILSQYSNIDGAQLTIRPFWKTSLPTKPSDVKVIVNYPQ